MNLKDKLINYIDNHQTLNIKSKDYVFDPQTWLIYHSNKTVGTIKPLPGISLQEISTIKNLNNNNEMEKEDDMIPMIVKDDIAEDISISIFKNDIIKEPVKDLEKHMEKLIEINKSQPEQRTTEWYKIRTDRLTASDLATSLNQSKYDDALTLLLQKCNMIEPFSGNEFTLHGERFEIIAQRLYEKIKTKKVLEFGLMPHPEIPFLGASPDGITTDGCMLEIKCPPKRQIVKTVEKIPKNYWIQIQLQLEVCNLEDCDFMDCNLVNTTKEEWLKHKNYVLKGIMLEKKETSKRKYSPVKYETKEDLLKWERKKYEKLDPEKWESHYWTVLDYGCSRVKRNRENIIIN